MLQSERRVESKRMELSRPLEVVGVGDAADVSGFTKNMSDSGIRARFDTNLEPGANVMIRLFWQEGEEPVQKQGMVVWSAPDLYGEGTEVGLRLMEDHEIAAAKKVKPEQLEISLDAEKDSDPRGRRFSPAPVDLMVGSVVRLVAGGIEIETVVGSIGELDDDGNIHVVLQLDDDDTAMEEESSGGDLDPENWKPHPFKDAYAFVSKYLGPVARVVAAVFVALGATVKWAWRKLPFNLRWQITRRTIIAVEFLRIGKIGAGFSRLAAAIRGIGSKLRPSRVPPAADRIAE